MKEPPVIGSEEAKRIAARFESKAKRKRQDSRRCFPSSLAEYGWGMANVFEEAANYLRHGRYEKLNSRKGDS